MNRGIFNLRKWHNPDGREDLQFDYSGCDGNIDEVIMALISAEKMFRCYPDPRATGNDKVLINTKIDAFLKTHFLQYNGYCGHCIEYPGSDAYKYYTHLREDDLHDDLTILGIKRK